MATKEVDEHGQPMNATKKGCLRAMSTSTDNKRTRRADASRLRRKALQVRRARATGVQKQGRRRRRARGACAVARSDADERGDTTRAMSEGDERGRWGCRRAQPTSERAARGQERRAKEASGDEGPGHTRGRRIKATSADGGSRRGTSKGEANRGGRIVRLANTSQGCSFPSRPRPPPHRAKATLPKYISPPGHGKREGRETGARWPLTR